MSSSIRVGVKMRARVQARVGVWIRAKARFTFEIGLGLLCYNATDDELRNY